MRYRGLELWYGKSLATHELSRESWLEAQQNAGQMRSPDLGFTYKIRQNKEVEIYHHGRLASTLRGTDAKEFAEDAPDQQSADAQQLMARITGNYKHGNER